MIFSDRFEAGQKLAQKILDDSALSAEFSSLVLAFSPDGNEIAKGVVELLKIPLADLDNNLDFKDKIVFLIDDGALEKKSLEIAMGKVRGFGPKRIVIAMPIIAKDSLEEIKNLADQVFYLEALDIFFNVNQFYQK